MRLLRYLLPLLVTVSLCSLPVYADRGDHSDYDEELNERDFDALRQFINSKRTLDLQEKSCNLTLSGDVRTEWRHLNEKGVIRERHEDSETKFVTYPLHYRKLLGKGILDDKGVPLGKNDFDIEFNMRLDYIGECAWAVAHVAYDNSAGVDSGNYYSFKTDKRHKSHGKNIRQVGDDTFIVTVPRDHAPQVGDVFMLSDHLQPIGNNWFGSGARNDVNLRKAYMGINLYDHNGARFDVELGRRNLYNVFDSKVQFLSRFDGILLKYNDSMRCADWYVYLAGFVIDERVNHYGWVTELGLENICDMCLDVKYSFIDWNKKGKNRKGFEHPEDFKFKNSQVTFIYRFEPSYIKAQAKVYGAFIANHDHPKFTPHKVESVTDLPVRDCRPCESEVQIRELCPICTDDRYAWYIGFTLGKVCQQGDWALDLQYQYVQTFAIPDRDVSGIGRGNFLGYHGNTNYKGLRAEFLYAVTDNLSLNAILEGSKQIKKYDSTWGFRGGRHRYSKFELEAIYAF